MHLDLDKNLFVNFFFRIYFILFYCCCYYFFLDLIVKWAPCLRGPPAVAGAAGAVAPPLLIAWNLRFAGVIRQLTLRNWVRNCNWASSLHKVSSVRLVRRCVFTEGSDNRGESRTRSCESPSESWWISDSWWISESRIRGESRESQHEKPPRKRKKQLEKSRKRTAKLVNLVQCLMNQGWITWITGESGVNQLIRGESVNQGWIRGESVNQRWISESENLVRYTKTAIVRPLGFYADWPCDHIWIINGCNK